MSFAQLFSSRAWLVVQNTDVVLHERCFWYGSTRNRFGNSHKALLLALQLEKLAGCQAAATALD